MDVDENLNNTNVPYLTDRDPKSVSLKRNDEKNTLSDIKLNITEQLSDETPLHELK